VLLLVEEVRRRLSRRRLLNALVLLLLLWAMGQRIESSGRSCKVKVFACKQRGKSESP
jgi:hypothetical protein